MEQINKDIQLKKIRSYINPNLKIVFDTKEPNEAFFASDTGVCKYNYTTGFITEKLKISESKILKLIIQDTPEKRTIFCLTKDNHFLEFDVTKKSLVKKIKLPSEENNNYLYFVHSAFFNSFIILSRQGTLLYLKNKIDTFSIDKEIKVIEENMTTIKIPFFELNLEGKVCMFAFKNKLILHNLISNESKAIEFQKLLSAGIFLGEDKVVLGDFNGKLHFISNLKEKKHSIATKHWHSHKVSAIESDDNSEYLYTAGEEGVIVIWNLKTEMKSFLPRLCSGVNSISISPNNGILALNCKDQSVKFVNLFNFTVINEYSGVCLQNIKNIIQKSNLKANEINPKVNSLSHCIKPFSIKNENYALIFNENTGKMQILNITNGKILSNSSLMTKNFTSATEQESINFRKLVHVEINKPNLDLLVTYEEITDDKDKNFLISYLKFWRVNNIKENFSIDLLYMAENPHNNEKVTKVLFTGSKCVTVSNGFFKVWDIESRESTEGVKCNFIGSYRGESISTVEIINGEGLISLHAGKYLVEWSLETREITRTYNFDFSTSNDSINDNNEKEDYEIKSNPEFIIIYSKNKLICFSLINFEITFRETFEAFSILPSSVGFDSQGKVWIILQNNTTRNDFVVYGITINNTIGTYNVEDSTVLKKNNISYINLWKNYNSLLIINSNLEVFVSKKKSLLGKKQEKREEETNNIEIGEDIADFVYDPKHPKNNNII